MKTGLICTLLLFNGFNVTFSQSLSSPGIKPLNIDFMNRGYFYASSPQLEKTRGLGGWADSGNLFKLCDTAQTKSGNLSIYVNTKEQAVFCNKYAGWQLSVLNDSGDTLYFEAQDSRLNMKLQALNKKGEWKDIEYLPSSWCGNSYHWVYLPSRHYWEFIIPQYEGKFKTQLRAVLQFKNSLEAPELLAYSNVFEGSVNPGQFSKMQDRKSANIMDPYDD